MSKPWEDWWECEICQAQMRIMEIKAPMQMLQRYEVWGRCPYCKFRGCFFYLVKHPAEHTLPPL